MAREEVGWYYLHVDGSLHFKHGKTYDDRDFADASNVLGYWKFNIPISRENLWKIFLEALSLGMNIPYARFFAKKYELDAYDLYTFLGRVNPYKEIIIGLDIFLKSVLEIPKHSFLEWMKSMDSSQTLTFPPQPESRSG